MINVQTIMLVALGFLVAALIALLVAPAYRRRAARLTTEAMKRAMPLTEAEIRADRDRLRAEYAITIHRLEMKVSEANVSAARQRIELNRRDAAISDLEGSVSSLRTHLDEHENARRVLEQTLTDRLPKIEGRLTDAKKMLMQRDREITSLSQSSDKQSRALEEVTQINTQQRIEIERLNSALATRAARNKESLADSRFDSEVALRSEIEALRAKNRDQASHIVRLQGVISRRNATAEDLLGVEARSAELAGMASLATASGLNGAGGGEGQRGAARGRDTEHAAGADGAADRDADVRALRAGNEDQATEIARLKAAVASYRDAEADDGKDTRLAMKAQLSSLKVQSDEQMATIQRLRAEIATANERLARQSQHFRDELRRLGAGTVPAAPAAEVARNPAETTAGRRSLAARIAEPRPPRGEAAEAAAVAAAEPPRPSTFLKALEGGGGFVRAVDGSELTAEAAATAAAPKPEPANPFSALATPRSDALAVSRTATPAAATPVAAASVASPSAAPPPAPTKPAMPPLAATPAPAAATPAAIMPALVAAPVGGVQTPAKPAEAPRRPRLMERLAGSDKS